MVLKIRGSEMECNVTIVSEAEYPHLEASVTISVVINAEV
jgi:hypothetical protein